MQALVEDMKKAQVFIKEEEIQAIVNGLGFRIQQDYQNIEEPLIVVGLLKGSFIFMADLVRQINLPMNLEFMTVSSYNLENKQEKELKIIQDINTPIAGRDVILVEDIMDTGRTFSKILDLLSSRNPKSLKTCALLNKKECRVAEVTLDYCGIEIPNKFVYGYGLDNSQLGRNLPYIAFEE